MNLLIYAVSWVALGFLTLLGVSVVYYIWTGRIDLSRLISEPNGDASMSRFQLLIFTFVIAASLFLIIAAPSPPHFPEDVPRGVLLLLGISSSSYLVSKGIQFSKDQGVEDRPPMVTVSPSSASTQPGGPAVQFTAQVTRTTNESVTWSIDPPGVGTIDKNTGVYTPPAAPPPAPAPPGAPAVAPPVNMTIRATSVADPAQSGTASLVLS